MLSAVLASAVFTMTLGLISQATPASAQPLEQQCEALFQQYNTILDAEDALFSLPDSLTKETQLENLDRRAAQVIDQMRALGCFDEEPPSGGGGDQDCGLPGAGQDVLDICRSFLLDPTDFATRVYSLACGDQATAFFYFAEHVDPNVFGNPYLVALAAGIKTVAAYLQVLSIAFCGELGPALP